MSTSLKKYNLQGEEIGFVEVGEALATAKANSQLVKDYIVALRANARQWSACTKTRSEVSHSTQKPHAQKGGGRSRQGSLVAPQYKGGGRVFGPKPKPDFYVKVNQKERRAALRALLAEKIRDGRVVVVDTLRMEGPKTKVIAKFLDSRALAGRVLFLGEGAYAELGSLLGMEPYTMSVGSDEFDNVKLSVGNIPGVAFTLAKDIDGFALAAAGDVVVTQEALRELEQWLV